MGESGAWTQSTNAVVLQRDFSIAEAVHALLSSAQSTPWLRRAAMAGGSSPSSASTASVCSPKPAARGAAPVACHPGARAGYGCYAIDSYRSSIYGADGAFDLNRLVQPAAWAGAPPVRGAAPGRRQRPGPGC